MADADQSAGQHMKQEAAQELMGGDGHDLLLAAVGVISPEKRDPAIAKSDQAMVGNGNAMGVSSQIVQHEIGSAEGRLGVDHPVLFELLKEPAECRGAGDLGEGSVELELAILV